MHRIHADPCDQFDRIPDSILLIILNRAADVRTLGRCSTVSKRFSALVPLVHNVHVKIDRVVTIDEPPRPPSPKPRIGLLSHLLNLVLFALFFKPFRGSGSNSSKPPVFPQLAHHSPAQVLRRFAHVRDLTIELPAGDVETEEGVLLKWRAVFGSTLQSCVILGGTRIDPNTTPATSSSTSDQETPPEDNGSMPESFYTNGGLKLRVVWTISSLIAASTRHYLLRTIVKDHPNLRSVVLTDADGQGTLSMGVEQLKEFRERPPSASSASSNRTQVPASNMKLRHAPYLELTGGKGMQGATLVTIKPSSDGITGGSGSSSRRETEALVCGAFSGPFRAAAKALLKRRTYLLEMNGF